MAKKKVKRKTIKRKLDDAFSKYIRWRAADSDGMVKCVTCNKIAHVTEMQNGHFQSRKHHSIRWHKYGNCNVQCYACNISNKGEQWLHGRYIDKHYGEGTAEQLYQRSKEKRKFTIDELIQLEQYYKQKVNEYTNKHS